MEFDSSPRRSTDVRTEAERGSVDERCLYGEPCHESNGVDDEQRLYGEPQHDPGEATETRDVELLFARLQNAPLRPDALGSPTRPSAETTER